jgi:glycosyltransferase involved in cell wall biosynthesis
MKVLHLPTNIASQISVTVQALRDFGIDARGLVLGNHTIQDPTGIELLPTPLRRSTHPIRGRLQRWANRRAILDAIRWADVIHWHFGWALPKAYDVQFAAKLGKPGIVEFWGSDVRIPKIAASDNSYMATMYESFPDIERKNEETSPFLQRTFKASGMSCLIPDPELLAYIDQAVFPCPFFTQQRISMSSFPIAYPEPSNKRPLVIHMPSNTAFKGTDAVLRAVESLQGKQVFDFRLIHGVKRSDALQILQSCDVFLDQFVIGGHGLATVESMSFGKPTVCYIKPSLVAKYPLELPIVVANQDNLAEVLGELLMDGHRRHEIGQQSRAYVEKYHDSRVIARQLIDIYMELIEKKKRSC